MVASAERRRSRSSSRRSHFPRRKRLAFPALLARLSAYSGESVVALVTRKRASLELLFGPTPECFIREGKRHGDAQRTVVWEVLGRARAATGPGARSPQSSGALLLPRPEPRPPTPARVPCGRAVGRRF